MLYRFRHMGYTLVELMVSMVIAAMLLTGLTRILSTSTAAVALVETNTDLTRRARFAMSRIVDAVRASDHLMIPMADDPATNFDENVREQTIPPSPPQGSSTLATAVLAITINRDQDLDGNGVFDADNDDDGRLDEDLPADIQNDGKPGIRDFDDDGNGLFDFFFTPAGNDDEKDFTQDEDPINGVDDDGDGTIDEDPGSDMNADGAPGVAGIDDDGDGNIDEGSNDDDDEDGQSDEDWFDPVVFYLDDTTASVIERRVVPWDESGDSQVNGQDWVESVLAENVTHLRFERVPLAGGQQLMDITLTLAEPQGETITLNTRVRLGSPQ